MPKTLNPNGDGLLSLAEAGSTLRCSLRHTHRLVASGELPAVKSGRRTLIRQSAIDGYIAGLPAYGVAA